MFNRKIPGGKTTLPISRNLYHSEKQVIMSKENFSGRAFDTLFLYRLCNQDFQINNFRFIHLMPLRVLLGIVALSLVKAVKYTVLYLCLSSPKKFSSVVRAHQS